METTFDEYLKTLYPARSGTRASYLKAIKILDEIFRIQNPLGISNQSLADIRDPYLIADIIDFVVDQEDKFRRGENSIFDYGSPTQTSYPRKRFCTAAIRRLGDYITQCCSDAATEIMRTAQSDGSRLSRKLLSKFRIDDRGTDREVRAKHRVGQDIFRAILLDIYEYRCCLTGIDVPEVLRAYNTPRFSDSHKDGGMRKNRYLCGKEENQNGKTIEIHSSFQGQGRRGSPQGNRTAGDAGQKVWRGTLENHGMEERAA